VAGRTGYGFSDRETTRSNDPDGRRSIAKVRKLQRGLWAAAKQSPERRFHALYDRVHRGDVLWEAWERVRVNRGSAGVDRITLAEVEEYGAGRMLAELQEDLRAGCAIAATNDASGRRSPTRLHQQLALEGRDFIDCSLFFERGPRPLAEQGLPA
jgi:hypothetical protein